MLPKRELSETLKVMLVREDKHNHFELILLNAAPGREIKAPFLQIKKDEQQMLRIFLPALVFNNIINKV